MASSLDARTWAFVDDVLAAIAAQVSVLAAFVLGSGAAGGFDPATSDVDLVVVVERELGPKRGTIIRALGSLEVPVRDLELVIYVEGSQPPNFELNLNEGAERPSEEPFWFVLDAALAQEHAVPAWGSRPWTDFFAEIPPVRIREAMAESLDWAERQPPDDEFARIHATRARHYLAHGQWLTKNEAGG